MKEMILLVYLVMLSIYDVRECKVPVILLSIGGAVAAGIAVYNCWKTPAEWQWIVLWYVLGMLPGIFVILMAYISKKIGYGDGITLILVGMLTGYRTCLVLLCFSLLLMSVCCIGILLCKKGNRNTRIPYLPFLGAVFLAGMFI